MLRSRWALAPLVAAALSLTSIASHAAEESSEGEYSRKDGWNAPWALLFQANNILVQGSFLGGFGAGGGIFYTLSPTSALRVSTTFGRSSNPTYSIKQVDENGQTTVTSYDYQDQNPTSSANVTLNMDYLKRLSLGPVAPFAGVGMFGSMYWEQRSQVNDVEIVGQVDKINRNFKQSALGARGILGAEWRIHSNFAFFAEYGVSLNVVSNSNQKNVTGREITVGDETTVQKTTTHYSQTRWFTFSGPSLQQGALLGLSVLF